MANDYARSLQLPTGTMQARDLIAGDVILMRALGESERTPHTVTSVTVGRYATVTTDTGITHQFSPDMTVGLA